MQRNKKQRLTLFALALLSIVLAGLVLGGCTQVTPTATPVPTKPPEPTKAPTATAVPTTAPATSAPVATSASVATTAPTAAPTTAPTTAPTVAPTQPPPTAAPTVAAVQPDVAFYNGKTVTFVVATSAGGGYDTYARAVAPYVQKYLPGSTVIVKNSPGAGHIIGANEVYNAKPDGLTFGTFNTALIFSQIVGSQGIQFDLTKYSWIAKMASDNRIFLVGAKTPYKTFDDAVKASQTKPIVMSSAGLSSASNLDALLLSQATGLKINVIAGYTGNDSDLAILRGEVEGEIGSASSLAHFVDSGDGRIILQIGMKKDPSLGDAPLLSDIVASNKKAVADLILVDASIGRLVAAPPGVPEPRRQALIQAFQKAMADPDYLAAMQKQKLPVDPAFGDDVGNLIKSSLNQSPEDLATLKSVLGPALSGN
jgi:tripartite-type tricarboxylate transporter receptor subunit TctC